MSAETWTYSEPGIVEIVGDYVSNSPFYAANMKVVLTQGTIKYFVITDATYNAVDEKTYLTLDGQSKYTLTSDAITLHQVSTWSNPTAGFPLSDPANAQAGGVSGGQTIFGGTGSGDDLTLESTAHATKGDVYVQPSSGAVGIGVSASLTAKLHILDNGTTLESLLDLITDDSDMWDLRMLNKAYSTDIANATGFWQDNLGNFFIDIHEGSFLQCNRGIVSNEYFETYGDSIYIDTSNTPASSSAAGDTGQICWDANYIYVCVATNTWKRAALASW